MADIGVALAHLAQEGFELRPLYILARSSIEELPIELHALKLAEIVLLEGAHADIADHLAFRESPGNLRCNRLLDFGHSL